MKTRLPLPMRLLIAVLLTLATALTILIVLYATDLGLSVWGKIGALSIWAQIAYGLALFLVAATGGVLIWRAVALGSTEKRGARPSPPQPVSEDKLLDAIGTAAEAGVDTSSAQAELVELHRRRQAGEVFVAMFGRVSTGKSSIVGELLPEAEINVDARAGTTHAVTRYVWTSPADDKLVLSDVPGFGDAALDKDETSREEAIRAHVVIFVAEGDLTRSEQSQLAQLAQLGKPIIVALNKSDRHDDETLQRIRAKVRGSIAHLQALDIVSISAGGQREVIERNADGTETTRVRTAPARIKPLTTALQRAIDRQSDELTQLRDTAAFHLAQRKLDDATMLHRRTACEAVISGYARKAVFGALAAVTPGTDVVIQGYLGVRLVQELCAIHQTHVKEIAADQLLELTTRRLGRYLPVGLALAGNALKAFPGIGTLTGGIMHAVAYGLIFESLGHAVARTLENRGELDPLVAARTLEEQLSENIESRASHFAGLVANRIARQTGE